MSFLAAAAAALRTTDSRFPWVGPTPEEDDVAELLLHLDATEPDDSPGRVQGEAVAVEWLGRAADRVHAHARAVMTISSRA